MTATHEVMSAMRKRYAQPQWALLEEVRDAAGHASRRSADAVAMSLWPSRGLEIHGFEVKVSRSDWSREMKSPEKAESVARFCDRWWLVAGSDLIVRDGELPPAWGLLVYADGALRTVREADKTEAQPVSRSFLAALLRRADETTKGWVHRDDVVAQVEERVAAQVPDQVAREVEKATREYAAAAEKADVVRQIEEALGEPIREWIAPQLREAMAIVRGRRSGWVSALERDAAQARSVADDMERLGQGHARHRRWDGRRSWLTHP